MKFNSFGRMVRKWLAGKTTETSAYTRKPSLRLKTELLEDRTLLAVLPAPVIGTGNFAPTNGLAPQVVIDPINPQKLVVVYSTTNGIDAQFTTDGGNSWVAFSDPFLFPSPQIPSALRDPNIPWPSGPTPRFAQVTDPSITFDRTESFYIVASQHSADYGSGAIVLDKFDFSGPTPVRVDLIPSTGPIDSKILYRWLGVDAAYSPMVAVDNNLTSYTDPKTGGVQTDSLATLVVDPTSGQLVPKAVFVAWSTDFKQRTIAAPGIPLPPTVPQIMTVISGDGGVTFTTQQAVSDDYGNFGPMRPPSPVPADPAFHPQIFFTQGTSSTPGGRLGFVWENSFGGVMMDLTQPDSGSPTQSVGTGFVVASPNLGTFNGQVLDAERDPATPANSIPQNSTFTLPVDITDPNFTTLADLDVTVSLRHSDMREVRVQLRAPDGTTITLVRNKLDVDGTAFTPARGISGANLGLVQHTSPPAGIDDVAVGAVFDNGAGGMGAKRSIADAGAASPYIGHFQPESGSLTTFNGLTASQLKGTWSLIITDFLRDAAPPVQYLHSWSLAFSSQVNTVGFGDSNNFSVSSPSTSTLPTFGNGGTEFLYLSNNTTTTSALVAPYNANANPAGGTPGVGPSVVVAVDNTLGSTTFNVNQGTFYVGYTRFNSSDSDVFVNSSRWGTTLINTDSVADNFSEGNRPQFMPSLAVDPVTGTLVVMWYDGRYDPSIAAGDTTRVATFMTTSIDGGDTFAEEVYLNQTRTATDVITGQDVDIEPIPSNQGAAGTLGFGYHQSVVAYGGKVYPFWAGNQNTGGVEVNSAQVTIASGPRGLTGDMGPVTTDYITSTGLVYNNTFTADGTRQLDGFVVNFDRFIDPGTFDPADVALFYQNPTTGLKEDLSPLVTSVVPLNAGASATLWVSDSLVREGGPGQTSKATFTVVISQPQANPLTIQYATVDGSAKAASDYTAVATASGQITIPTGLTSATFTIDVPGDSLAEGNENFKVNISIAPTTGITLSGAVDEQQTLTLDPTVKTMRFSYGGTLAPLPWTVPTGTPAAIATSLQTNLQFIPALSVPGSVAVSAGPVGSNTYIITFQGATALGKQDVFPLTIVTASPTLDSTKTFIVETVKGGTPGTATVIDDEAAPTLTLGDSIVKEGNISGVNEVQTLTISGTGSLEFVFNGFTAPVPLAYTAGVTTALDIQTYLTTNIPALTGNVGAPNIAVFDLGGGNFQLNFINQLARQDVPAITEASGKFAPTTEITKGTGAVVSIPVYLSTSANVTVDWTRVDSTTTSGDFVSIPSSGTLTFTAGGPTTQFINIPIQGDATIEGNENFFIRLSNAVGATVIRQQATGTVVDDDYLGVSIGDLTVQEGTDANATLDVYLNGPSSQDVTVSYTTSSITTNQFASSVLGFSSQFSTTSWAADQATGPSDVFFYGDDPSAWAPRFSNAGMQDITLGFATPTFASGVIIRESWGNGFVTRVDLLDTNNIYRTVFSGVDPSLPGSVVDFTINFTPTTYLVKGVQIFVDTDHNLSTWEEIDSVQLLASGSAATPGTDFTTTVGTVTIPAGSTRASTPIQVPILNNLAPESTESFFVTLTGVTTNNASILRPTSTINIIDDDTLPTLTIGSGIIAEGDDPTATSNLNIPIYLSYPASGNVTGTFSTSGGTASGFGVDYDTLTNAAFLITAGSTMGTLTIPVRGDLAPVIGAQENLETIGITLTVTSGNATVLNSGKTDAGTIVDDDVRVSIGDASALENGGGNLQFPLFLNTPKAQDVEVTISISDGGGATGAVNGTDYSRTFVPLVYIIPAGSTSGPTVSVPRIHNGTITANTTFQVNITQVRVDVDGTPTYVTAPASSILDGNATGTIIDVDAANQWSIGNMSVIEDNPNGFNPKFVSVPVYLSQRLTAATTIEYYIVTSTGGVGVAKGSFQKQPDDDFVYARGTLTFPISPPQPPAPAPPVGTSQFLNFQIDSDAVIEPNETFQIFLTTPSVGAIRDGTSTITIIDDDAQTVAFGDTAVIETDSGFPVSVGIPYIVSNTSTSSNFIYNTVDGTALSTVTPDYTAVTNGNIFISSFSSAGNAGFINVSPDTLVEGNENFTVNVTLPPPPSFNPNGPVTTNTLALAKATSTITIVDNDNLFLTVGNMTFQESQVSPTTQIPVYLNGSRNAAVTVNYAFVNQSAINGIDFIGTAGTLTFAAGEKVKYIPVSILGDGVALGNKTFGVTLNNPTNAALASGAAATMLIMDKDLKPALTVGPSSVVEGNAVTTFQIISSSPSGGAFTIPVQTTDGSAVAASGDYTALSTTATLPAGQTSVTVPVNVLDDGLAEGNETFQLQVTAPAGTVLGGADEQETITITGKVTSFALSFQNLLSTTIPYSSATTAAQVLSSLNSISALQNNVSVTGPNGGPFVVTFAGPLTNLDVPNLIQSAVLGGGTVTVTETVKGGTGGDRGTGLIVDNEAVPTVNINDVLVLEGTSGQRQLAFTVFLSSPTAQAVTVAYATADGTALFGQDYLAASGLLTIPAGEVSGTIVVSVLGDILTEGDDTFTVNLTSTTGQVTLGKNVGQATIINDDSSVNTTQFLVRILPQSRVGTYSYAIGPHVQDLISQAVPTVDAKLGVASQVTALGGGAVAITETAKGTSHTEQQTIAFQGAVTSVLFQYNGVGATPLAVSPTTTPAQVQANLNLIPALANNVLVTGSNGGPFVVTFTNALAGQDAFPITPTAVQGGGSVVVSETLPGGRTNEKETISFSGQNNITATFSYNGANAPVAIDLSPTTTPAEILNHLNSIPATGGNPGLNGNIQVTSPNAMGGPFVVQFLNALAGKDVNSLGVTGPPLNTPVPTTDGGSTQSTLDLAGFYAADQVVRDLTVNLTMTHPLPDFPTISLINQTGGKQTIVIDPTVDTFSLRYWGSSPFVTGPLKNDATLDATAVQTYLETNFAASLAGNITVSGPVGGPFVITYKGSLIGLPVSLGTRDITRTGVTLKAGATGGDVYCAVDRTGSTTSVVLSNFNAYVAANPFGFTGANFTNTTFDDFADTFIGDGKAPFSGTFRPVSPLAAFRGVDPNGIWTLDIDDSNVSNTGSLKSWSLDLQTGVLGLSTGNEMDQNQNAFQGDKLRTSKDAFAIPTPLNGDPFQLPYTKDTLPLIIPGPQPLTYTYTGKSQESLPIPSVGAGGTGTANDLTLSPITLSGISVGELIKDVNVNVTLTYATDSHLRLTLIAPDGTRIMLADQVGTGANFTNTLFDDQAFSPIQTGGSSPFSSVFGFQPAESLNKLNGRDPNGTWQLEVNDLGTGTTGTLQKWSLSVLTERLVLNNTVSSLDVVFDRDIQANTFTPSNVLRLIGPIGEITGAFSVTPINPAGIAPNLTTRTFRIGFPVQQITGSYGITFGPDLANNYIKDVYGNKLDINSNAGVDVLRGGNPQAGSFTTNLYKPSTPLPASIPANSSASYLIDVPTNYVVQDLTVKLNIFNSNVKDLKIELWSPGANPVKVTLFDNPNAVAGSTFNNTTFSDAAPNNIINGTSPYTTSFSPQFSLSAFKPNSANGPLSALGTWSLVITNRGGTNGTIDLLELNIQQAQTGSGLGEGVADQFTRYFRIFTQEPSNPQSNNQWTAIGPNNGGDVPALAIDPSDPSGNTVYAGAATGGLWKTSNFLTTDVSGPTWIPLIDLGGRLLLNIGSIAVFGQNNDPSQSIIYVGTGGPGGTGSGMLRSTNGGLTWTIVGATEFSGRRINKIVVDPVRSALGEVLVYAAVSNGSAAGQGIFRSVNSGNTWTQILVGDATDLSLSLGSKGTNGNLQYLYAGIRNNVNSSQGVYFTANAPTAASMILVDGGVGVGVRRDFDSAGLPAVPVDPSPFTPGTAAGGGGGVYVATPIPTGNPLQDAFYQEWVYAVAGQRLFMSKDLGNNWTQVRLSANLVLSPPPPPITIISRSITNDETKQDSLLGFSAKSLTVDPLNPNIVYIAQLSAVATEVARFFIKVDVTTLSDAYALVAYDHSENDGGNIEAATLGAITQKPTRVGAAYGVEPSTFTPNPLEPFYNLSRDPLQPFAGSSQILLTNVSKFNNDGGDAKWQVINTSGLNSSILQGTGNLGAYQLLAMVDPVTGQTRLISGGSIGVGTVVLNSDGTQTTNIGTATAVAGNRTGNMLITRVDNGAIQPSASAASLAKALFYASAFRGGVSSEDLLTTGNISWPQIKFTGGGWVAADPSGSGESYQYFNIGFAGAEFFEITLPGASTGIARTNGLLLPTAGWFSNDNTFAVNPLDPTTLVLNSNFSSFIFRTSGPSTGKGLTWVPIADVAADMPTATFISSLAFGAPPLSSLSLNDFIYAGTGNGEVFVTFTGGAPWTNITGTGLGGGRILRISPNPKPGEKDVYVVTSNGVYYLRDATAAGAPYTWTKLNDAAGFGNLFTLQRPVFGGPATSNTVTALTSMAVDWRYAIPDDLANPNPAFTHPVLYVGADAGVFRSLDKGLSWTFFPDIAHNQSAAEGGYLPAVQVNDLDLAQGNTAAGTGVIDQTTSYNMLVASTEGRSQYVIRLDDSILLTPTGPPLSAFSVLPPVAGPRVIATSTSINGIIVTFSGPVDPSTFTTADIVSLVGPAGAITPTSVVDITPTPASGPNPHNIFQITFPPNAKPGSYQVTFGPNLSDFFGHKMDQDQDGIKGEPVEDQFSGTVFVQPFTNSAPVLNNAVNFPAIAEGDVTNTGTDLATWLAGMPAGTITDPDDPQYAPGTAPRGIAAIGVDNSNGTWQYSLNGGTTWTSFGTPTNLAAVLLNLTGTNRIRFVPNGGFIGQATFTFRAWDLTSGQNGDTNADTSSNGVTAAFSADPTALATISVSASNDAPVITVPPGPLSVLENSTTGLFITGISVNDSDAGALDLKVTLAVANGSIALPAPTGLTFTDSDGSDGTLVFTGTQANINASLAAGLLYLPDTDFTGTETLSITVDDLGNSGAIQPPTGSHIVTSTVNLTVIDINSAPRFTVPASINVVPFAKKQTLLSFVTGISAGPNEPGQTLKFTISIPLADKRKFRVQPTIDANGTLIFQPNRIPTTGPGVPVTITLADNGGTANGGVDRTTKTFYIVIVNNAPIFTLPTTTDYFITKNTTTPTIAFGVTDIDVGDRVTLRSKVTSGSLRISRVAIVTTAGNPFNRTVKITPRRNSFGTADITITAKDLGGATTSFVIHLIVNDPPTFPAALNPDVNFPHKSTTADVPFQVNNPLSRPLTVTVGKVVSLAQQAVDADAALQLKFLGNYFQGKFRAGQEKRLGTDLNPKKFYYIKPNGDFYEWGGSVAKSKLLYRYDASFYADPEKLWNPAPVTTPDPTVTTNSPVFLSGTSGVVQLQILGQFSGTLAVPLSVTDGLTISTRTFLITAKNEAPTFVGFADPTQPPADPAPNSHKNPIDISFRAQDNVDHDTISFSYSYLTLAEQAYALDNPASAQYPNGLDLRFLGTSFTGKPAGGTNEKWFRSAAGELYFIRDNGDFYKYVSPFANSRLVTRFNASYYNQPELVGDAYGVSKPVPAHPDVTLTPNLINPNTDDVSGTLQAALQANTVFEGTLNVTINALDDAGASSSHIFQVTFTNNDPTVAPIPNPSDVSHSVGSLEVPFTASDIDNDPLTFAVELVSVPAVVLPAKLPTVDTTQLANGKISLGNLNTYAGKLMVTLIASDGMDQAQQTFEFNVTNNLPTIAPNPDQANFNATAGADFTVPYTVADGDAGDTLVVTATVETASDLAFRLDNELKLNFTGNYFQDLYHQQEKWIRSGLNNNWYAILPNGELHSLGTSELSGGSEIGPLVATLEPAFWDNPELLWNAQPSTTVIDFTIDEVNKTITLKALPTGTIFVTLKVSDGIALSTKTFKVIAS